MGIWNKAFEKNWTLIITMAETMIVSLLMQQVLQAALTDTLC